MRKILFFLLTALLLITCKSQGQPGASAVEIIEPEFEVVSIFIIQADLVVTEFEAVLRVNNPNAFDLELSEIVYELYGNGAFWANGRESNILRIPAQSTGETSFSFSMNFINMSRRLLDDVITMRRVNYRFKGGADIMPVIRNGSAFNVEFDCSGLSEVRQKRDAQNSNYQRRR
ncbi:MAG: LEA type 2 family protein [Treponema sp.]|jgi:LEA14-like dessication related protein|nr:LEA type 2 family protein [Treponema sp.]